MIAYQIQIDFRVADAHGFAQYINSITDSECIYSATVGSFKSCYVNSINAVPGTQEFDLLSSLDAAYRGKK